MHTSPGLIHKWDAALLLKNSVTRSFASSQNKCKKTKNYNKEGITNEHLRQKEKI
jgi:hypothetical protein